MSDLNIPEVIDRISTSTTQKGKTDALHDLKHVLDFNRHRAKKLNISERSYSSIYEILFSLANSERSTYLKAAKPTTKSLSTGRLETIGSVLRSAVELGVRKLQGKTVNSILDHVIHTLSLPSGNFLEPLLADYLKCMLSLFEYQPHVEHLAAKDWIEICNFCIRGIETYGVYDSGNSLSLRIPQSTSRSRDASAESFVRSGTRESTNSKTRSTNLTQTAAQDFVLCLRQLLLACNAPTLNKAPETLDALIGFLHSAKHVGRAHQDAFAAINSTLATVNLHTNDVAQDAIRKLVPIIRDLWPGRAASALKDEILATLAMSQDHVSSILAQNDAEDGFRHDLRGLVDSFESEYAKRNERDQLQVSSLRMEYAEVNPSLSSLSTPAFSLKNGSDGENPWAVISLIGTFTLMLDRGNTSTQANEKSLESRPSKRMRYANPISSHLNNLTHPQGSLRTCALQVLSFMLYRVALDDESIKRLLEKLSGCVSDKTGSVSVWALLCISSLAFSPSSKSPELTTHWLALWEQTARIVAVVSSCRPACLVLDVLLNLELVSYSSVSILAETTMSSAEHSGPVIIADSSLMLFQSVIIHGASKNPSRFDTLADRSAHWLLSKCALVFLAEKSGASQEIEAFNAADVLRLIRTCLDQSGPEQKPLCASLGPIGQAFKSVGEHHAKAVYVLLLDDQAAFCNPRKPTQIKSVSSGTITQSAIALESHIIALLGSQIEDAMQRLGGEPSDHPQILSKPLVRNLTMLSIIASAVAQTKSASNKGQADSLRKQADTLIKNLLDILAEEDLDSSKTDVIVETLIPLFPMIELFQTSGADVFKQIGLSKVALHLVRALETRESITAASNANSNVDEMMDLDDEFDSQTTPDVTSTQMTESSRIDSIAKSEPPSVRASVIAYLRFINSTCGPERADEDVEYIPSPFVDWLATLSATELGSCRAFLDNLLQSSLQFRHDDAETLLTHLGETILGPYAHHYGEVGLCLCLDSLTSTVDLWTDPETDSLHYSGIEIYGWIVNTPLKSKFASTEVQTRACNLYHAINSIKPDFKSSDDSSEPSPRTLLLDLLQKSNTLVRYYIAEILPDMFDHYILSKHRKIYEDVFSKLPDDSDWIEAMAIRSKVLSNLAARWPTLLRLCVYHIYEAAAMVPSCADHAKVCINDISKSLALKRPQELFTMFAQQILFTWMEDKEDEAQKLDSIPFAIFSYESCSALLDDIRDEAYAQALMRASSEDAGFICDALELDRKVLLEKTISKVVAYTMAWDSEPENSKKATSSREKAVSALLGENSYPQLVRDNLPRIMGYLLLATHDIHLANSAPAHDSYFNRTREILREIKSICESDMDLPDDQQPLFAGNVMYQRFERLCRRASLKTKELGSPRVFIFVMRMLLSRILPALGSLHACSMIRKIRILVALSGDTPLEGYPLQMSLHSLRPFLTDPYCADDTLGIVQYLFTHGKQNLRSQLRFVAGNGLSILMSLRSFTKSKQSNTTQESQHLATMSKAESFHQWLASYLVEIAYDVEQDPKKNKAMSVEQLQTFQAIIGAASKIQDDGSSSKDSAEGILLLELLKDDINPHSILDRPSQELAFSLLSKDFCYAPSAADDIISTDAEAVEFAPSVWRSCRHRHARDEYLVWGARILGRAFCAQGHMSVNMRKEQLNNSTKTMHRPGDVTSVSSRAKIMETLRDYLFSDSRRETGLTESTLRLILSQYKDDKYDSEIHEALPMGAIISLRWPSSWDLEGLRPFPILNLRECAFPTKQTYFDEWIQKLCIALLQVGAEDPILGVLPHIVDGIAGLAERLFPCILHMVLQQQYGTKGDAKGILSEAFNEWFELEGEDFGSQKRAIVTALVYLRSQPVPLEETLLDRSGWLDIDLQQASKAAADCGLYRVALLFLETYVGSSIPARTSRRSSALIPVPTIPTDLQVRIFRHLDEPDSFYGVEREPDISSILSRLDYEGNGMKSLLFRGARMDSQMRRIKKPSLEDSQGTIRSLSMLNLNTVTQSLLSSELLQGSDADNIDETLSAARRLEQWDLRAPETRRTEAAIVYQAFQSVSICTDANSATKHLDSSFITTMKLLNGQTNNIAGNDSYLRTLAVLSEADDVLSAIGQSKLSEIWENLEDRAEWMDQGRIEDIQPLLSCRETLFSIVRQNDRLRESLKASPVQTIELHASALASSCKILRKRGVIQDALVSATVLSDLRDEAKAAGTSLEGLAMFETACILWDQGETTTAVRMLRKLNESKNLQDLLIRDGASAIPLQLGQFLAISRLESPQEIIDNYLVPAIKELRANTQGSQAGEAYHTFAAFCDAQLNSAALNDDMDRVQQRKSQKEKEIAEFEAAIKSLKSKETKNERDRLRRDLSRIKKWYDIDQQEFGRLQKSKEEFVVQSLKNYLLALRACDKYDTDVLRVFSLWLDFAEASKVDDVMKQYLDKAPTSKFTVLMNQLSSRLQDNDSSFQRLLFQLVFRVCRQHPYHGMHQIYAGQSSIGVKDDATRSRVAAAKRVAQALGQDHNAKYYWKKIHDSNACYHEFSMISKEEVSKRKELKLDDFAPGKRLQEKTVRLQVPPATLSIEVRASGDYTKLPVITGWRPKVSIAGGLSAPKIVTAYASNGEQYKQLFKSGTDDLRQDAIMEQVFEQASSLLKGHAVTRSRNLHIRSYKVLPLSSRSGLIEFVKDTIPLGDVVLPAHRKYHPKDWKNEYCRTKISEATSGSADQRVKAYRDVTDHFHPVMRFFFLERFPDPDDWFHKRLAYTRTTAAISILGHVLGLGDRHCQNILLDQTSGEVVHIDLGVAFDAGRVLPVPEVVPFRLTRDLVDAMGFTKTEGVFRRCCEFVLEILREEKESIMILLNVLRYDPLVSWTVSANRARRMQEAQEQENAAAAAEGAKGNGNGDEGAAAGANDMMQHSKKRETDGGEAGRALAVVEQKLSKHLGAATVVSGLIQQATDERNLAMLFSGWSAHC